MLMTVFHRWLIWIFILFNISASIRTISHNFNPQCTFISLPSRTKGISNIANSTNFNKNHSLVPKNVENLHNFVQSASEDGNTNYFEKTVDEFFVKNRTIFLSGELNDKLSFKIISSILRINDNDPNLPIKFYINSPGGSVTAGLAIYDLLQSLNMPVETVSLGQAASMGAFLLASGTKGKRFAMPNSRIMIHQPLGGAHGQASDIEIQANEILQIRHILNSHLSHFTGKSVETIEKDCTRDNYMRPSEAIEYGLIDGIIDTKTSHIVPELPQKV